MHVPDHFLDAQTSIVTGAIALTAVGHAARTVRAGLADESRVPLAGLVASFVFAAQMVNFPVGSGTSGHLLGGVLAAVLVGPAAAIVCVTGVLVVQALFFADGGVTALGVNVTLMSVVGVLAGWAIFRAVQTVLPRRASSVPVAAAVAALVSVPVVAGVFAGLYLVGGSAGVPAGELFTAMLGWHALIGVGEALITAAVVAAVMAVRPDLVFGHHPSSANRWKADA